MMTAAATPIRTLLPQFLGFIGDEDFVSSYGGVEYAKGHGNNQSGEWQNTEAKKRRMKGKEMG